ELLIEDPKLQKELSEKSLEQAKKFSWEKMAQEVIQVFEKI
ncbi:MAG: Glycosyl transferase group 1, partial [Candidatus Daviesbacteria bacterium GW2011_GWA1_38_7]